MFLKSISFGHLTKGVFYLPINLIMRGNSRKKVNIFDDNIGEKIISQANYQVIVIGGFLMGKRIGKEKVKRESGYLYYIGKDGYVWRAPMKTNKRGRKKKVGTENIKKQKGYMYYLDKAGYVAEAKMARR